MLWERGPSTVREVHDGSVRRERHGYTTVLKLMQIMAARGWSAGMSRGDWRVYHARWTESVTQRRLVADLLDRAFGGSGRDLVMQALSARRRLADELAESVVHVRRARE